MATKPNKPRRQFSLVDETPEERLAQAKITEADIIAAKQYVEGLRVPGRVYVGANGKRLKREKVYAAAALKTLWRGS